MEESARRARSDGLDANSRVTRTPLARLRARLQNNDNNNNDDDDNKVFMAHLESQCACMS